MMFSRKQNPNYSKYFPNSEDTSRQRSNANQSEPQLSFKSQPISNSTSKTEESPGFLASLFGESTSINQNSEERICSELLDINKTVLVDQSNKLISLKIDKNVLLDEINGLEKKFQRQKNQDKKEKRRLQSEVDRLNKLIKILSTELK